MVASILGFISPGTAHATPEPQIALSSSEPQNGAVLDSAPTEIVLNFDQEVPLGFEDAVILNCSSQPMIVEDGETENDRTTIRYAIATAVPKGQCVLNWLLDNGSGTTAASGVISFKVSTPAATTPSSSSSTTTTAAATATASPQQATGGDATPQTTGSTSGSTSQGAAEPAPGFDPVLWFSRLVSTAGILILFGALVIIGTGWPEGPEYYVTSRFMRMVWGVSLAATVFYVIAFASQVRGASLAAGLSPAAWLDLSQDGWPGIGAIIRLAAVAGSGYVALRPERLDDPNSGLWSWILPAIAVISVALSRVSGPAAPIGVLLGIVHAFGAAVWFGGAAFVGRVVLAGPGEEDLVVATNVYSRSSLIAIFATVITGVAQTVRLDSGDIFGNHGRVVIFKVVAVAVMLFIGLEARKQVRFRLEREYELSPNNAARFRRAYGSETLFGIIALALSSVLVSISPGTELPWAGEDYVQELQMIDRNSGIEAVVQIGPLEAGKNGYVIQVEEPAVGISELRLRFIPPEGTQNGQAWIVEDIIPLTGRGSVWRPTEVGIPLSVPGVWKLRMISTTQQDSQAAVEVPFTVEGGDGGAAPVVTSTSTPTATSTTAPQANINVVPDVTTTAPVASAP